MCIFVSVCPCVCASVNVCAAICFTVSVYICESVACVLPCLSVNGYILESEHVCYHVFECKCIYL